MARKKLQEAGPEEFSPVRDHAVPVGKQAELGALSYEAALSMLEATVTRLENGSMPLEESLDAFDEGIGLVRLLTGRLDAMEQRMLVLLEGKDGPKAVPYEDSSLKA